MPRRPVRMPLHGARSRFGTRPAPEVHRNDLAEPLGLRRVTVHTAVQGEFQFLSGPCIVAHKGRLFACWTNSPRDEDPSHECLRGRWSADGGMTWGPVQVVAGDATPGASYGHGSILSSGGTLRVFAARFLRPKGAAAMVVNMEAVVYDDAADRWDARGTVAEEFWAMEAPHPAPRRRMDPGRRSRHLSRPGAGGRPDRCPRPGPLADRRHPLSIRAEERRQAALRHRDDALDHRVRRDRRDAKPLSRCGPALIQP